MLLYHGTDKVFPKFTHGRSGYMQYKSLPKYDEFGNEVAWNGGARMITNPGGIYLTENYWEASAYMDKSGPLRDQRILMVDVGSPKIYNCEYAEYIARTGDYGHSWSKFDQIAYELSKEHNVDIVCMKGVEDCGMLRAWPCDGGDNKRIWSSDDSDEGRRYDQYICHKPELLRIVGEYLHYHQEAA